MKKNIIKFFIIIIAIFIGIFAGYENPDLVEVPKRYYEFIIKKFGFKDNFLDQNIDNVETVLSEEKQEIELNGNSFSVFLSKVKAYKGRSASLIFKNNNKNEFEIFTQEGFEIKKNSLSEINLPSSFYREKSGGVPEVRVI